MKIIDQLIFGIIALSLSLIAARPFYANALGHRDITNVNIATVGGNRIHGAALPTK